MSKLAVIVLGRRKAGKSSTWNQLFGRTVRTGRELHKLVLRDERRLPVFLVSGSPQERGLYVEDVVDDDARIVLCSLQYTEEARDSIRFFREKGYQLYVQWLNPGFSDAEPYPDTLGFLSFLLHSGATVTIRDGRDDARKRVREIHDFIFGWIANRRL